MRARNNFAESAVLATAVLHSKTEGFEGRRHDGAEAGSRNFSAEKYV